MRGLQTQNIDIPLAHGLDTKSDSRALQPPGLPVAKDVQVDDIGGIQTREQYQDITSAAANTIANIRKIVPYGNELVAFSKDKLWSYASGDGLWTERAEYLAVKVDEHARFVTTGDQYDCDRAELGGVTMYCWSEDTPSGTTSYVAAIDTATGAVKLSPTALPSTAVRPSLLASTSSIFLAYETTSQINVRTYTPGNLSSFGSFSQSASGIVAQDMCIDESTGEALVTVSQGTSYKLLRIAQDATLSASTFRTITTSGAISIARDSVSGGLSIVRWNAPAIEADTWTDAFVSVTNDIPLRTSGAVVNQITSVYDGSGVCSTFWSAGEVSTTNTFILGKNSFTSGGSPTGEEILMRGCGLASHSFRHDGATFCWLAFAGESGGDLVAQLQNTYFLLRSDGLICAKAVSTQAGGFGVSSGRIPKVQDLGSGAFAFCGEYRRIIPLGDEQKGYSAQSPQDVVFEFDSNEARRTAQLGETLYISGGFVSQYDGANVTEVGFHNFPFNPSATASASGTNLTGDYNYRETLAWYNAKGELDRSTTASIFSISGLSGQGATVFSRDIHLTAKTGEAGEVAQEVWRQVANAAFGAPFFLITSKDPSSTGANAYQVNTPLASASFSFLDDLADDDLISREPSPENGGLTLENLAPPGCSIIHATQDRLIFAGIPGLPNRLGYTKLRGDGEVASCHDSLYVDLPPTGGDVTAIGYLNETLIVFKETAIYALSGDGFDNNGGGQNYGPARLLNSDVGAVSQEALGLTPKGIIFQSSKGWYLLNHGWSAGYVGNGVEDFNGDTVVSTETMESQHQVRIVTTSRTIIWDYLVGEWFEWSRSSVSACMWNGAHHVVSRTENGVLTQSATHNGNDVDMPKLDIETGWIKVAGLQGFKRVKKVLILGEWRGTHHLRVKCAYNYDETWVDDKTWTPSPAGTGPLQVAHRPKKPKCQAIKLRITAEGATAGTDPATYALNLTGLTLVVGLKPTSYKSLGAAQKQ